MSLARPYKGSASSDTIDSRFPNRCHPNCVLVGAYRYQQYFGQPISGGQVEWAEASAVPNRQAFCCEATVSCSRQVRGLTHLASSRQGHCARCQCLGAPIVSHGSGVNSDAGSMEPLHGHCRRFPLNCLSTRSSSNLCLIYPAGCLDSSM